MRRFFGIAACAIALALASAGAPRSAPAAEAGWPNIVLILADDLGIGGVNAYGADPALVRTPAIDRLAREGRRFTDACTPSSVCSPTRYGVLTGRYAWRTSLEHEVLNVNAPLLIEPIERLTLASLLQRQGYRTAAIGKWHLGYGATQPVDYTAELRPGPLEVGFHHHFGVPSNHGDITGVYVEDHRVLGLRSPNLRPFGASYYGNRPFMGIDAPQRIDEDVMDGLTTRAVKWIEAQKSTQPFFLYFTPVAVHEPSTPSARTRGSSACGTYGDWVHELDASVARLLEALDRLAFTDNTLVVFTSDNGGVVLDTGERPEAVAHRAGLRVSGPWRGRKHSVYEGGFRVPFLVRWPGHVPAATDCSEMIGLVDLLATTAAIVGAALPAAGAAEDSVNVLPALLGQATPRPLRDHLILHSADGNFAIRRPPWKWIEGKPHPATRPGVLKARAPEFVPQLYNLQADPAETRDLIAEHPDIARALAIKLDEYRATGRSRP